MKLRPEPIAFEWDPGTHQPHSRHTSLQRRKADLHALPAYARQGLVVLPRMPRILNRYRRLRRALFQAPVRLAPEAFGLSTDGAPERLHRVLEECHTLGVRSLLVRWPTWEPDRLGPYRDLLDQARAAGIEVMVTVLQNRQMVTQPELWRRRLEELFQTLGDQAGPYQIGHAWNRRKWGVHSYQEYLRLLDGAEEARRGLEGIRFAGPGVIDFEWHQAAAVLLDPRRQVRLDVVASLLYADRRGEPESRQYGFDLPRKVALLRAVADASPDAASPLWITETNWPLRCHPSFTPAARDVTVDEQAYADYMVRYHLLALATGLTRRIYWWKLAAHGFGLIDDAQGGWRPRDAYAAYRTMLSQMAGATIHSVEESRTRRVLRGTSRDDRPLTVAWAVEPGARLALEEPISTLLDRDGRELRHPRQGRELRLSASPVYLLG